MKIRSTFFKLTTVISLIIAFLAIIPHCAFSLEGFGGNIDLFTQKTPFNGRGPNQPSDAFQPQELAILYALVTFSQDPVAGKAVAFQVNGPVNTLQNITVIGVAMTNGSGIAEFSFRIQTPPSNAEQIVFGEWHAVATVDIDEIAVNDSLTFEVGWIISIKNIVTLNGKLSPQTDFPRESTIVFDLTLENIALTPKPATITVDTQDVAGHPIIYIELYNLTIQPGESHAEASSQIPENAELGEANVSAAAYTAPPAMGGTPYCPPAHISFNIITVKEHDVAITNVYVSSPQAYVGESVEITVEAANLGDFSETFNVTVYYDSSLIQVIPVISLSPHSSKTITVEWNTSNVKPCVYTISANATIVEGDVNPENNNFLDGMITILSVPASFAPYSMFFIVFLTGLGILAGLAFLMLMLIYHNHRRRKRKARRAPRYAIIVHPHI